MLKEKIIYISRLNVNESITLTLFLESCLQLSFYNKAFTIKYGTFYCKILNLYYVLVQVQQIA